MSGIDDSTAAGATWEAYSASAIGADHVRAGRPNEDAVATERIELPGVGLLAFAVADGHGHSRHFRSERGSRLAVAAALAATRSAAAELAVGVPRRATASALVTDIVTRWRAAVAADLADNPLSTAEAGAVQAGDPPEIPYGATLLMGVVSKDAALLAQIGDGDMFVVQPDGALVTPVPGDDTLDGTRTTSICQPDAVSSFRVALVSFAVTPVFAVFAATDGYGNAQAKESWRTRWASDLVTLGLQHGSTWIGRQLADWAGLCASSGGSGDDTTVALALNAAAVLTAPQRDAHQPEHGQDNETLLLPGAFVAGTLGHASHVQDALVEATLTPSSALTATAPAGHPHAGPPPAAPLDTQQGQTLRMPDGGFGGQPPYPPDPGRAATGPARPGPGLPGPAPTGPGPTGSEPRRLRWVVAVVIIVALAVVAFFVFRPKSQPPGHPGFSPSVSATPSGGPHSLAPGHSHGTSGSGQLGHGGHSGHKGHGTQGGTGSPGGTKKPTTKPSHPAGTG